MSTSLAIVIPVLDEAATLAQRLLALEPLRQRGASVVVVDGGSADDTLAIARKHADVALVAPRGRGAQMNAGARACTAGVLLFLHADTTLPDKADTLVLESLQGGSIWGRFDVRIDSQRPIFRCIESMMNWRSRWSGIATGDQAVFVRRDAFDLAGGFPDIPLMEDIALSRGLKRIAPPVCLRDWVITSARRWERHGVWRTVLLMWRLRAAYFLGADPASLAVQYGYVPRSL
ncbi:TIGR04283 family arsenosugar biosynthesis glycosyltransferase [Ramlibacter sp.]|uniref:TIGR04283 family arsenosugar biosynthesis glycosyltransferase n=1 Tax=Ramlibacter sp. TaxID=1917967 RepID=UPI0025EBFF71|nr:TIGR04283 family arsenosugar biosynthesis glycosyltransferase [Ramlibacter sp.]